MSALALPAAIFHLRAATAKERGSGAAARTSVAASCGWLRAGAARLLRNARANDFDLQSLRSFFAHNEPVTSKQCSNTSWGHAGPLVIKSVQVGNELQVRCVRHLVSPDWPRSNSLHVDARIQRICSGFFFSGSPWSRTTVNMDEWLEHRAGLPGELLPDDLCAAADEWLERRAALRAAAEAAPPDVPVANKSLANTALSFVVVGDLGGTNGRFLLAPADAPRDSLPAPLYFETYPSAQCGSVEGLLNAFLDEAANALNHNELRAAIVLCSLSVFASIMTTTTTHREYVATITATIAFDRRCAALSWPASPSFSLRPSARVIYCGLYSYGLYGFGLYGYGLCSYGPAFGEGEPVCTDREHT